MVVRGRGGCVGWTAVWDLLLVSRQICGSWRQQEAGGCLMLQRPCHVGHRHQISPVAPRRRRVVECVPAAANAAVPWDHHCREDRQAQEQQESYQMPARVEKQSWDDSGELPRHWWAYCNRLSRDLRPDVEGLIVDGEDAEDGLLHRPLAPVVAVDELIVLEPLRQRLVADQLALALLALVLVVRAFAGSGRGHWSLLHACACWMYRTRKPF